LKAGNGQEIAISPDYASLAQAEKVSARLTGKATANKSTRKTAASKKTGVKPKSKKSTPQKIAKATATAGAFSAADQRIENYKPLAFYQKYGGKADGFNSFEENGAYYFHYNEGGEIVLISESYTTKAGRDNGIESVKKNINRSAAYQYHKHKNGKHYFDLNAGNHQEIVTSRWYGSAAAATAGAAYLLGTRRRVSRKTQTPAGAELAAGALAPNTASQKAKSIKKKPVNKTAAAKPKTAKKKAKPAGAALAAGAVAASAASAKAKSAKNTTAKKTTAAKPKSTKINTKPAGAALAAGSVAAAASAAAATAKPKTVEKKTKPALGVSGAAAAGLSASAAEPKPNNVEAVVPEKVETVKSAPAKAAPIAAAAIGTASVAGAAAMAATAKTEPVAAAPISASPVAATTEPVAAAIPAAAAAATPAAVAGGGGIWGWLKWVLMALIALIAVLFLFKSCVGGDGADKAASAVTTETAAPAAMVTCWNGSKAKNDQACPTKVTCWDDSFAVNLSACPAQPVAKDFVCWDGSNAVDSAGCPVKPAAAAKTTAGTTISGSVPQTTVANATAGRTEVKMSRPSVLNRICAPSSNPLFNVSETTPVNVGRLGTNPQFGNSLSYTPDEFYRRLQVKYRTSPRDKSFLDLMARSLGYDAFANMDASMFSNDTLTKGTTGLLGFGAQHALQFSTLNVKDQTDLEAFKVRSANGTDVHFMKRCGNFMYVCQP